MTKHGKPVLWIPLYHCLSYPGCPFARVKLSKSKYLAGTHSNTKPQKTIRDPANPMKMELRSCTNKDKT